MSMVSTSSASFADHYRLRSSYRICLVLALLCFGMDRYGHKLPLEKLIRSFRRSKVVLSQVIDGRIASWHAFYDDHSDHHQTSKLSSLLAENTMLKATLNGMKAYQKSAQALDDHLIKQIDTMRFTLIPVPHGYNPYKAQHVLSIGRGKMHGILRYQIVFSSRGIIGYIDEVFDRFSYVHLLTNTHNMVPVMLAGDVRQSAVLQGKGDHQPMVLLGFSHRPSIGQMVMTSGAAGRYPLGIVIGHVTQCQAEDQCTVKLIQDPLTDDYVYVMREVFDVK